MVGGGYARLEHVSLGNALEMTMVASKVGIEEVNKETWEEFEEELSDLSCDNDPEWLFRGHNDSEWKLESTLDRITNRAKNRSDQRSDFTLLGYYRLMLQVLPRIEEETGRAWPNMPALDEYTNDLAKCRSSGTFNELPGYEFMVYLRHHGFPSPLLDWTFSPYIAAFFAFEAETSAPKVSIYAYREKAPYAGPDKRNYDVASGGPYHYARIVKLGKGLRTHKRHFLQQSHYTFCARIFLDAPILYASHEEVVTEFEECRVTIRKYCIPTGEREKVLASLRRYNLNSFSLFGTIESLMRTLWLDLDLDYGYGS